MNTREEQIELVKKLLKTGVSDDARMVLEKQFPEVVKSEDERIRKEIVDFICWEIDRGSITNEQRKRSDSWIAYLEKQKSSAEEILTKAGIKPCKDGNQWSILVGDNIQEGICGFGDTIDEALYQFLMDVQEYLKEQKPAVQKRTLKDEAERFLNVLSETPYNNTPITNAQVIVKELITFLESPEKYNPNHISAEWSEEDEEMLDAMVDMVSNSLYEPLCPRNKMLTWLKSLSPQSHWKPSQVQMEALAWYSGNSGVPPTGDKAIKSLYNDLKKL